MRVNAARSFSRKSKTLPPYSTAIGDEQNLGRDLREAIRYGGRAEIGRAAAPNRAARRRRQHRRHGLNAIRQNAGDAVAFADPQRAQKIGHRRDLAAQLRKSARLPLAAFVNGDNCDFVVVAQQQILRVI